MTDTRAIATDNEILRGLVGSTAHGVNIPGQDDRDEMGVFIEPPEYVCGLSQCDHYIYRTQPEGVRSGPGDLDLTMYSLKKFCRLAVQGNPSVLVLLWLPEYLATTDAGDALVGMREAFVSRSAGERFLGYLRSQKARLTGERSKNAVRPELVEAHGYDTKFAMHAVRLGFEGVELMTNGRLTLPVKEPNLTVLRYIRVGRFTLNEVLDIIANIDADLEALVGKMNARVDLDRINRYLVDAHQAHWARLAS